MLIAPTNELVAELNERARLDRLRRGPPPRTRTVTLGDGLTASAGDWIATRKNARWLHITGGGWVKNGHRWVIRDIDGDGSMTVHRCAGATHQNRCACPPATSPPTPPWATPAPSTAPKADRRPRHEALPHRRLRHASPASSSTSPLTRGKHENHLYFSTAEADPHRILAPKATHPPTAVDILTAILRRDGAQISAHSAAAAEPTRSPGCPRRRHVHRRADRRRRTHRRRRHHGPHRRRRHRDARRLTDCRAWPVLRRSLALLAIDGHDPIEALHQAAHPARQSHRPRRPAGLAPAHPARSAAESVGPLRWLPAIPDALTGHPQWGPYLDARAQLVAELAEQIRDRRTGMDPATAPAWARPLLADQPQLMAEIAVFRAAHDVDPADTRITGPEQHANRSAAFQQLIHGRVDAALRRGQPGAQRWRSLAEGIDAHITADPFWPRLATHLDHAARAGADVAALLTDAIKRHGPLPDELPAAALWWRLAGTLAPPTLDAANTGLRPAWTPELHRATRHPASPKPSPPTRPGPRWSPPSPPPTGTRATYSPQQPNTCATSPTPNTRGPTNTPAC